VAKAKVKVDPQLVAKARELRDRYLERANEDPLLWVGPGGKYDISRALGGSAAAAAAEAAEAEESIRLPHLDWSAARLLAG
jgi:hypothetical protein